VSFICRGFYFSSTNRMLPIQFNIIIPHRPYGAYIPIIMFQAANDIVKVSFPAVNAVTGNIEMWHIIILRINDNVLHRRETHTLENIMWTYNKVCPYNIHKTLSISHTEAYSCRSNECITYWCPSRIYSVRCSLKCVWNTIFTRT